MKNELKLKQVIAQIAETAPYLPTLIEYTGIISGVIGVVDHKPLNILYGGTAYLVGRAADRFVTLSLLQNKKSNAGLEHKIDQ